MSNQKNNVRYHALDGLRGVLMLLGVVIHLSLSYSAVPAKAYKLYNDPSSSYVFTFFVVFIHSFRMPLFYLVAGFFTALLVERRGLGVMFQNRFKRIFIPFVVSMIFLIPLVYLGIEFSQLKPGKPIDVAFLGALTQIQNGQFFENLKTYHLWFLYYLMIFYASTLIVLPVLRRIPKETKAAASNRATALITSPWAPVFMGLLTFPALIPACIKLGMLQEDQHFIPNVGVILAYAPFFYFGWFLYTRRELLDALKVGAKRRALFGMILLGGVGYLAIRNMSHPVFALKLLAVLLGSLTMWLFSFSFIGLFLKYADKPSPTMRYLMDSSYWVYLIHLPITRSIPSLFHDFSLSAYTKFAITFGITTLICLLSYHFLVRATFLGELLNGRKYSRKWPVPEEIPTETSEKIPA